MSAFIVVLYINSIRQFMLYGIVYGIGSGSATYSSISPCIFYAFPSTILSDISSEILLDLLSGIYVTSCVRN